MPENGIGELSSRWTGFEVIPEFEKSCKGKAELFQLEGRYQRLASQYKEELNEVD